MHAFDNLSIYSTYKSVINYPYSDKSSTELQAGERRNEAKIHRQHQDERKVLKLDQVSGAAKSEDEGRIASPVAAKEKDLKLTRYFRSSKVLHAQHTECTDSKAYKAPFALSMIDSVNNYSVTLLR